MDSHSIFSKALFTLNENGKLYKPSSFLTFEHSKKFSLKRAIINYKRT